MTAKPDFAAGAAFVDGAYVPVAQARIPITDWGFTRSDVTYDVVSVWNGAFFRLEDHLARFEASVAGLRLRLPVSREGVSEILTECVRLAVSAQAPDAYHRGHQRELQAQTSKETVPARIATNHPTEDSIWKVDKT